MEYTQFFATYVTLIERKHDLKSCLIPFYLRKYDISYSDFYTQYRPAERKWKPRVIHSCNVSCPRMAVYVSAAIEIIVCGSVRADHGHPTGRTFALSTYPVARAALTQYY